MKKLAGVIALILAVIFLSTGLGMQAPGKYISSYGSNRMTEYVGGDAYNYIIEASLRGGEIAGAVIARAVYLAAAAILAVMGLALLSGIDLKLLKEKLAKKTQADGYTPSFAQSEEEPAEEPAEESAAPQRRSRLNDL